MNIGREIDNCDVVVRCNTPKIVRADSQGTKITFLYVTKVTAKRLPKLRFPTYTVVNVSCHVDEHLNLWTQKLRDQINDIKARPTTGFIAATHMIDLGYKVKLFGFDWFDTPSLATTHGKVWEHHYPEWEKNILLELLKD